LLDDSAATMFDTACFSEVIASAMIQRALPQRPAAARLFNEGRNLSEAERYYRDAITLDPLRDEARVRLARVLSLRGRHAEALGFLQAPMEQADAVVRYFGALALGEAAEATKKPDIARQAYERALQLFPSAQSPLLALMRIARERGDDAAAKELASRFVQLGPNEHARLDPWWDYFDCNGRNRRIELELLWALYRTTEQ
jgi:tetratricopeptide (TPR) repeat protein